MRGRKKETQEKKERNVRSDGNVNRQECSEGRQQTFSVTGWLVAFKYDTMDRQPTRHYIHKRTYLTEPSA